MVLFKKKKKEIIYYNFFLKNYFKLWIINQIVNFLKKVFNKVYLTQNCTRLRYF